MVYYAHSKNLLGIPHLLKEHLIPGQKNISTIFNEDQHESLFRLALLFHDAGKYQSAFQDYLKNNGRRGCAPHAKFGALLAKDYSSTILPFIIEGHHKGLANPVDLSATLTEVSHHPALNEVQERFFSEMKDNLPKAKINIDENIQLAYRGVNFEFVIRYLFSLLTDADWLDTEAHFDNAIATSRPKHRLDVKKLINTMENEFASFSKKGSLNQLRNQVREDAILQANNQVGFFSLNLPTGLGKTLTSMYWALKHAESNNLDRIFIVLPFINIIDQTAKVFKDIFGKNAVLEHHSSVFKQELTNDELKYDPMKLASENWDYPIIITTTVQFFESLFSNKPSKCRKVHNLANAVVIFDEVQTLPKNLIQPALAMLSNMNTVINTSFLFCTATQPAFKKRENFKGIEDIQPLVKKPATIFNKVKRVEYRVLSDFVPIAMGKLIEQVCTLKQSTLIVCNTKNDALRCFRALNQLNLFEAVFHLSTSMCARHRRLIMALIRRALKQKRKIAVCSTQLIEAGVDFDFPVMFRALAPLGSIIQSAGRCNREGKSLKPGIVILFQLQNSGWPDELYKTCAQYAKTLILEDPDILHKHESFEKYYQQVISLFVDPDSRRISEARANFQFQTVAQQFKIIDTPTTPVFIKDYNIRSQAIYGEIKNLFKINTAIYRKIQPYLVQVYPNFLEQFQSKIGDVNGVAVWCGEYDDQEGIIKGEYRVDDFVL